MPFVFGSELMPPQRATAGLAGSSVVIGEKNKGVLYFNENGSEKGFGDGGITAILMGGPTLTISNLEFI